MLFPVWVQIEQIAWLPVVIFPYIADYTNECRHHVSKLNVHQNNQWPGPSLFYQCIVWTASMRAYLYVIFPPVVTNTIWLHWVNHSNGLLTNLTLPQWLLCRMPCFTELLHSFSTHIKNVTALMLAAQDGHKEIVKKLLESGANVAATNQVSMTSM